MATKKTTPTKTTTTTTTTAPETKTVKAKKSRPRAAAVDQQAAAAEAAPAEPPATEAATSGLADAHKANGAIAKPRTRGSKPKATAEQVQAAEPTAIASAEPAPATRPKPQGRRRARAKSDVPEEIVDPRTKPAVPRTLADLTHHFVASLAERATESTRRSYLADLRIAQRVLGADIAIAEISPERLKEFDESPSVTLTRDGRDKAAPGRDRMRRTIRLALKLAVAQGWCAALPTG